MVIIDETEMMENSEPKEPPIPMATSSKATPSLPKIGRYQHYKGNFYVLLYIAKHSETGEDMAVYRQLSEDGSVWVRPCSMFSETVVVNGAEVPRFRYIGK